jgi:hypothetical protein
MDFETQNKKPTKIPPGKPADSAQFSVDFFQF